jgi:very-short-patch-repair endonuclease
LTRGGRPFRGSVAVASGLLGRPQLRSATWRRLFHDVYVDASVTFDHRLLIDAALLVVPDDAVVCGRSAAVVWGAARTDELDRVEISSPRKFGPVAGLTIHIGPTCEVTTFCGIRVTSALHTAWDLGRRLPLIEAVPWIDALGRARRLGPAELVAHASSHRGVPGLRQAERALKMCDPKAESPPESPLRVELHLVGIMVVAQYWVIWQGEFIARVDLALPEIKLAIEYDGQWHGDHHQLGRDRARVRLLNQAGWIVIQVTKEDLRNIRQIIHLIQETIERLKTIEGKVL